MAEILGGAPTPGIGFGAGIERIIQELKRQGIVPPAEPQTSAFVVYFGKTPEFKDAAVRITAQLRQAGIKAEMSYGDRSRKAQMKQANASGAAYAIIIGENELEQEAVSVKDLRASGMEIEVKQELVKQSELIAYLNDDER